VIKAKLERRAERSAKITANLRDRVRDGRMELDKVEEARRRLERAPNNTKAHREVLKRFERRPAPPAPLAAPTKERERKLDEAPKQELAEADKSPLSGPRYRVLWPVDAVRPQLSMDAYAAAERLRIAFDVRTNQPKTTGYDRTTGGVPGSRPPIRDDQLQASIEFKAVWNGLPRTLQTIASNFILQASPPGRDAPLTMQEFGKIYGGTSDARRQVGVSHGAIITTCAVLARLFGEYDRDRAGQRDLASGGVPNVRKSRLTEAERVLLKNWNSR
jgi:hypothetical protein